MGLNDSYDHVRSQILMKNLRHLYLRYTIFWIMKIVNVLQELLLSLVLMQVHSKSLRMLCMGSLVKYVLIVEVLVTLLIDATRSMAIHRVSNQEGKFIFRRKLPLNMYQLPQMQSLQS